jgi:hypothetical protein
LLQLESLGAHSQGYFQSVLEQLSGGKSEKNHMAERCATQIHQQPKPYNRVTHNQQILMSIIIGKIKPINYKACKLKCHCYQTGQHLLELVSAHPLGLLNFLSRAVLSPIRMKSLTSDTTSQSRNKTKTPDPISRAKISHQNSTFKQSDSGIHGLKLL